MFTETELECKLPWNYKRAKFEDEFRLINLWNEKKKKRKKRLGWGGGDTVKEFAMDVISAGRKHSYFRMLTEFFIQSWMRNVEQQIVGYLHYCKLNKVYMCYCRKSVGR